MEKTKSEAQKLKEELFLSRKHGGLLLSEEELSAAQDYCEDYKAFLNRGNGRTHHYNGRECRFCSFRNRESVSTGR